MGFGDVITKKVERGDAFEEAARSCCRNEMEHALQNVVGAYGYSCIFTSLCTDRVLRTCATNYAKSDCWKLQSFETIRDDSSR